MIKENESYPKEKLKEIEIKTEILCIMLIFLNLAFFIVDIINLVKEVL